MKILALQLKRIGDLILTTPAFEAVARCLPDASITLGVQEQCAPLLDAIPHLAGGIVFGRSRGWTPWQQVLTGRWDAVLDFTGTDRSAVVSALSRARQRVAFADLHKKGLRRLAANVFVDSAVRDFHTTEHYLHLLKPLGVSAESGASPSLKIRETAMESARRRLGNSGVESRFALIHPGTARPEKFWMSSRWAAVVRHLNSQGLQCALTGGAGAAEAAHLAEIERAAADIGASSVNLAGHIDLVTLAAFSKLAAIVISCDTAAAHMAAAFCAPQIVLFGPTNPFHWRPRHSRAVVLSAAQPETPLTVFGPRMRGAPMEKLSTELVIRATDSLLQSTRQGGWT